MNTPNKMTTCCWLFGMLACIPGVARSEETAAAEVATEAPVAEAPRLDALFTMQDLSGDTKLSLGLPIIPGMPVYSGVTLAPLISGQLGLGPVSLALVLPLAVTFREDADDTFVLGNLAFEARYRACFKGDWMVCLGVAAGVSAGFLELDDPLEGATQAIGIFAHQDPLYHGPQNLVVRPLGLVAVAHGEMWLQIEFGSAVFVPIVRTEGRDTVADMLFQVGAGYRLEGLGRLGVELRGLFPLDQPGTNNLLWLNLGAWLDFGAFEPLIRLTIPLRDAAEAGAPLHLELGLAYRF